MKRTTLLLLSFLLITCKGYSEENYYAKLFSGVNFLQNTTINGNKTTYNTGFIIAGSIGYRFDCGISLEAEYAYRRNGINKISYYIEGHSKNGHYQASSYMANLLWDLPLYNCYCFRPFIGAGIGFDSYKLHASNSRFDYNQSWKHFSWQLMAGVGYPVYCNTELTFEYKYHHNGNHFYNHTLGVGVIYTFGL